MATASVTNTFSAATLMESLKVNENFQDLIDFLDVEVIHRDGDVAFTANVSQPTTPTADDHLTRKGYVDTQIADIGIAKTLVDAAGDLIVASADNTPARLAKGSDGTALEVAGGSVGWGMAPAVFPRMYAHTKMSPIISNKWGLVNLGWSGGTSTQATSGEIYYSGPFYVTDEAQVDNLGVMGNNNFGASRMAIYQADPATGLPKTLLAESASVAYVGNQIHSITATTLRPGIFYWLALQVQSTIGLGLFYMESAKTHNGVGLEDMTYITSRRLNESQAYGAFPATATPVRTSSVQACSVTLSAQFV